MNSTVFRFSSDCQAAAKTVSENYHAMPGSRQDGLANLKLERRASWLELRAVARMLAQVNPQWLERSRLPEVLSGVKPLASPMTYVDLPQGFCTQSPGGEPLQIIPEDWDPDEVMVVGHCIDRGSTGASGVAMIVDEGNTLTIPSWGVYHDGWNSVRPTMKRVANGSIWKAIVRLAGIANLPHGPYRSGSWGRLLTELHCRLCQEMCPTGHKFQAALEKRRMMIRSKDFNLMQEWMQFDALSICTGAVGTTIKFSRWFSVSQRWREIREDYWFMEIVYGEARFYAGGAAAQAIEYTSLWDSDSAATTSGSRLQTTVTYFSHDHARSMDAYYLSTRWLCTSHCDRMKSHLSIAQHIEDLNNRRLGLWAEEIENMLDAAVIVPEADVFDYAVPEIDSDNQYANRLLQLTLAVISSWLSRTMPLGVSYPDFAAIAVMPGLEAGD
jgi:hypothetical protein